MASARAARRAEPPSAPARRPHAEALDAGILEALRDRLIEAPDSSMAELSAAAGVGMSAIYSRFGDRVGLLRRLADEGNAVWGRSLDEAEAALDAGVEPWDVFERLMRTGGGADLTILGALTIGSFERTREELEETRRLYTVAVRLMERLHRAHSVRPGLTWNDVGKLQEAIGAIRGDGLARTRELQQRFLDVILEGLRPGLAPLSGEPTRDLDFFAVTRERRRR